MDFNGGYGHKKASNELQCTELSTFYTHAAKHFIDEWKSFLSMHTARKAKYSIFVMRMLNENCIQRRKEMCDEW